MDPSSCEPAGPHSSSAAAFPHGNTTAEVSRAAAMRAEQVRLLYANAPAGLVATGLNVGLLVWIHWPVSTPPVLLTWLTAMLLLTGLRAGTIWHFRRCAPAPQTVGWWEGIFGLGTALAGLGWGSAAVLLFPTASAPHQLFLTLLLGGMLTGAVGLLAARMWVFVSFAGPIVLPLMGHWLGQGEALALTMSGMVALCTLVLTFTAWKLHQLIGASLQLGFANADLVAAVTGEKAQVEHLNTQLTAEIAERRRAEAALQAAQEALEARVHARTATLRTTLTQLQAEMHERQQLAVQLRQAHKMEALGTLAGGIAHDFNNMLTAMLGYTELTLDALPPHSPPWRQLREVLAAGGRARTLVQQILTFSRQSTPVRHPLPLHQPVEEALALLRATLPTTLTLQAHLDAQAGTVLADPTQVQQVVLNLCTNAAQAMREAGGTVEVLLEDWDLMATLATPSGNLLPGPYVRLTVRDTGHGMTPDILERIYEPFFTTKAVGEGTGLGLAVVHGIVTSHGGAMTVTSTPGQGTTAVVYWPRLAEAMLPQPPPSEAPLPTGTERILLVDDEPALVALGHAVLTQLGYVVVGCTSSLEALELFRATPRQFALVITDYTMPALTGEALAQALRALRPDIPIILCSGVSPTLNAERATAGGMNAFLMKPWQRSDLARIVREVLEECG